MKYLAYLLGTVAAITMISVASVPSKSQDLGNVFFERWSDKISVKGYLQNGEGNPSCQLNVVYVDNSYFSLIKDLNTGEMWMEIRNTDWTFREDAIGQTFDIQWTFHNRNGTQNHLMDGAVAKISTTDTIQIRNMNEYSDNAKSTYLNLFMSSYDIRFFDGTGMFLINVPLNGSRKGIQNLSQCINFWGT